MADEAGRGRPAGSGPSPRAGLGQGLALDELHRQERAAVGQGAGLVDGRDARVLELAGDPGLVDEPAARPRSRAEYRRCEDLDRHVRGPGPRPGPGRRRPCRRGRSPRATRSPAAHPNTRPGPPAEPVHRRETHWSGSIPTMTRSADETDSPESSRVGSAMGQSPLIALPDPESLSRIPHVEQS